jgi:hypothetical protein
VSKTTRTMWLVNLGGWGTTEMVNGQSHIGSTAALQFVPICLVLRMSPVAVALLFGPFSIRRSIQGLSISKIIGNPYTPIFTMLG